MVDVVSNVSKRHETLLAMVCDIVPYLMQHNAESEACDLLMEIEKLDILQQFVDRTAYPRVCLYLRRYLCHLNLPICLNSCLEFWIWSCGGKGAEIMMKRVRLAAKLWHTSLRFEPKNG